MVSEVHRRTRRRAQERADRYMPRLKDSLSKTQLQRLRQIRWQVGGSFALEDSEVERILELSAEQGQAIARITTDFDSMVARLHSAFRKRNEPADIEVTRTELLELAKQRDEKSFRLLTRKQLDEFAKLKGEPFDLTRIQPPAP